VDNFLRLSDRNSKFSTVITFSVSTTTTTKNCIQYEVVTARAHAYAVFFLFLPEITFFLLTVFLNGEVFRCQIYISFGALTDSKSICNYFPGVLSLIEACSVLERY
jgi:hypothetical protein